MRVIWGFTIHNSTRCVPKWKWDISFLLPGFIQKNQKKYKKWAFCPILGSKNNGSNRTEVTSAFGGGQPASHLAKHLGGRGVGLNSPWGIRPFDSNAGRGYELEVGNRSNFPHAISRNMRCKPCPKKMNSFGTFPKLTNFCLKGLGRKITLSGAFLN